MKMTVINWNNRSTTELNPKTFQNDWFVGNNFVQLFDTVVKKWNTYFEGIDYTSLTEKEV